VGAQETGRASSATGYLLIEEMVGFVSALGCMRREVMARGLPRRRQKSARGRTLVLAMDTYTITPSPRKRSFY
jgi:hypothetical protein